MGKGPDCRACRKVRPVPGDAHSACAFGDSSAQHQAGLLLALFAGDGAIESPNLTIRFARYGFLNGWVAWPLNFDPVWLDECSAFEPKDDAKIDEVGHG